MASVVCVTRQAKIAAIQKDRAEKEAKEAAAEATPGGLAPEPGLVAMKRGLQTPSFTAPVAATAAKKKSKLNHSGGASRPMKHKQPQAAGSAAAAPAAEESPPSKQPRSLLRASGGSVVGSGHSAAGAESVVGGAGAGSASVAGGTGGSTLVASHQLTVRTVYPTVDVDEILKMGTASGRSEKGVRLLAGSHDSSMFRDKASMIWPICHA